MIKIYVNTLFYWLTWNCGFVFVSILLGLGSMCAKKLGFYELGDISDLILPVLKGKMNVVAQFVDHFLCGRKLTNHLYLSLLQFQQSLFNILNLSDISVLFILGIEGD
jgi:hypothetical protein